MKYIIFDIGSVVLYKEKSAYNNGVPTWLNQLENSEKAIIYYLKRKKTIHDYDETIVTCKTLAQISNTTQEDIYHRWKNWSTAHYKWTPGIADLIKELNNKHCTGVCSNVGWINQIVRDEMKVYDIFNSIVVASSIVGLQKPDIRIFSLLLKQLKLLDGNFSIKDVIFIDNKEINIASARKIGIKSIKFTTVESLENKLKANNIL